MDQIKTQLAIVLKYGFWIGCVLVLFGSLGVWWMTTSELVQQNVSQTGKIKTAISSVSTVRGELNELPNDFSHVEMQRLIDARQEKVLQSWELLYNRQRDILTWPVKELTPDFIDEFKDLIPMETHVNFPTPEEEEKETTLLTQYERYIKNVLPDIAKIARTEWTAEFDKAGGMMGMEMDGMGMGGYGGGMPRRGMAVDITGAKEGPLVKWSSGSQSAVLSDLFPWRGRRPTTLEVYYSQENIWILKQLLQIIADVNGDVTQPYQAKIHELRKIAIGKSVKFGAGNTSKPGTRMAGGGMGMSMDMEMEMGMEMEMDMGMEMEMGGVGTVTLDPGDNRYVNASLEKITGAQLRSALTSNSPSDASLAVAKRVPVMMSVSIDQRAVHELLAACGSAQLMVQVHQVRVLPNSTSSAGGGGMMGGMGGGMGEEMEMEMEMGGMGGMGGHGGMGGMGGGSPAGAEQGDEFPLDMLVDVYGIIKIYNPPDPVKFGVEDVTEDTVIDGETETIGGQAVAKPPAATAPPAQDNGELPTPQAEPAPAEPAPAEPAPAEPAPAEPAPEAPAADAPAPPVTNAPNPAAPVASVPTTTPPAAIIPAAVP